MTAVPRDGDASRPGRGRAAAATVVWLGGVVFSFALALSLGKSQGQALGTWLAGRGVLPLELGLGLGSVFGMAVVAAAVQLAAAVAAAAVRGAGFGGVASWRRDAAIALWWGIHTFPASGLYLVALPVGRAARLRLARRRPVVARVLAALYLAGFAVFLLGLVRWAPFFDDGEVAFFVAFTLVLGAVLTAWPERRREWLVVAAVALALYFALDPPQKVSFGPRAAVALGVLALGVGPALVAGREGCRQMGALGPTFALLGLGLWTWFGEFLVLPSVRDADAIAAAPGVTLLYRNGSPSGPGADNRFLMEACDRTRILYGSRDIPSGIVRLEGGRVVERLRVHTGYNLVTDCAAGVGYVGNYSGGQIERVDLASLRLLTPVPEVRIGGPTLLQLSPDGARLYAIDDTNGQFRRITLATGQADLELRECLPNGLFVDEELHRVYLPSCGWLDVYDDRTGEPVSKVDLRRGFDPPFPLGPHFHRITADTATGKAFVSYLETGRIYRVDGASGALEAETILGRGLRDLTWDAKNGVVWVGNYVTGELLAVDPASLAVAGRVQVGRRIRSIEPSLDGRRVYVTSAIGGVAVDVATVLGR
ncbi:MAG: hypothetical protein IPK07_33045 [Deltaproteobacteria bacterium]|nr:hypothetical protein [Deltaproteobacteria bacterium]